MDSEYEALMAELGGGKPKGPLGQPKNQSLTQNLGSQQANINRVSSRILPLSLMKFQLDAPSAPFGNKPSGGLVTPDQFHQKRAQQGVSFARFLKHF